jgi:hypothetical protein
MTKKEQNKIAKEIFRMVYNWGSNHIEVDHTSPAYKSEIGRLLGNKSNGFHKVGATQMECWIADCKLKHLPF